MKGSTVEMNRYNPEFMSGIRKETITPKTINKAIENREELEALVVGCNSDNTLKLNIASNIVGELPFNELEYHPDGAETKPVSAMSKVGKRVKFIPKSIENIDGQYVVRCNRKELQKECYENYIATLRPGDVIPARVVNTENYGLFCDIGCGIIALLPTNNISVTHVVNPKESLKGLKRIIVVVKEIQDNYRIQLTHRELLGTWEEEASKFHEGDTVFGTVLSVEKYGVFVRLSQNLSGLAEPTDIELETGDSVVVTINSIIKDNMKVKLIIANKAEEEPEEMRFDYSQRDGHISKWVYSTEKSPKRIETIFDAEEK
jgi:small subunit ribosomal protein S1